MPDVIALAGFSTFLSLAAGVITYLYYFGSGDGGWPGGMSL
jgi:hypothetical protein